MPSPSAMRSNTSSAVTRWLELMIALTLPWVSPQAMPIRVWLAPAYWRSRWNSLRMSRERKAWMVSGRCHNDGGTMIGSVM
jgi:hypothetical protein